MPSYQDLETRVGQLERKVALLMSVATVTKKEEVAPDEFETSTLTLDQLYRELSNRGEI